MKYKFIELDYLILCADRLTRFKPSFEKYERVYKDIINKYYFEEHKNLSLEKLASVACEIFNSSIEKLGGKKSDLFLNHTLQDEERRAFYKSKESEILITQNLNFEGLLYLAQKKLAPNLERLRFLLKNKNEKPSILRQAHNLKYPIEKVVLAEGITEEILLSDFSKRLGYDFLKNGVAVLGAGGKNQVARKYYEMIEKVKLPIFVLLDYDALSTKGMIEPKLRKIDEIYVIKSGEFEDIIPKNIILHALNKCFKNDFHVCGADFDEKLKTVKNLKEIYKNKGFGDFQKSDFASCIKKYLGANVEIKGEIVEIVENIKEL